MQPNGFSDDQLLATALAFRGAGDDAGQPESVRFLRGVSRLIKKRMMDSESNQDAPAVFLLRPAPPGEKDTTFHPMLDNGLTEIAGQLWLVGPVVTSGSSVPFTYTTDADIFNLVIDKMELGGVAAVIYDPRVKPAEVRYYPNGLSDFDCCEVVPIVAGDVDLNSVFAVIDRVHQMKLVTPNAQSETGKLWKNANKHQASDKAELTVQMYLETALLSRFTTCTVNCEQPQVSGRLDIEIVEPDPTKENGIIRHVLLELKVLRSSSGASSVSQASVNTWINEGVDQAYAYREERKTRDSALCCFDMRKKHDGDACFDIVRAKADRLRVSLRVWPVFPSAKAYRAHVSASAGG
ncbi:hypothetical protein [Micromonospora parva]|uniref:hypothetical protein n=1 Tax=Micromonospora parva TaxID=1464048 RepID=UPI003400C80B